MGMFSKDTPQPPDPIRTASAATATNVATSVANAFLNNVNQVTPQGSLQYDQTNSYSWTDPTIIRPHHPGLPRRNTCRRINSRSAT
jgi:hypothetical protein